MVVTLVYTQYSTVWYQYCIPVQYKYLVISKSLYYLWYIKQYFSLSEKSEKERERGSQGREKERGREAENKTKKEKGKRDRKRKGKEIEREGGR